MQATKNTLRKVWTFVSNATVAVLVVPVSMIGGLVIGLIGAVSSIIGCTIASTSMGIMDSMRRMEKACGVVPSTNNVFEFVPKQA